MTAGDRHHQLNLTRDYCMRVYSIEYYAALQFERLQLLTEFEHLQTINQSTAQLYTCIQNF